MVRIITLLTALACFCANGQGNHFRFGSQLKWAASVANNPPQQAAIVEQLKADTQSFSDGDKVPTWTAAIGKNETNGANNATVPVYTNNVRNGLGAVCVTNATQVMRQNGNWASSLSQPFTIMCVRYFNTSTASQVLWDSTDTSFGTRAYCNVDAGIMSLYAGSAFGNVTPSPFATGWHCVVVVYNGASSTVKVDDQSPITVSANPGTSVLPGLGLFNIGDGSAIAALGAVGEFIVWNIGLTTSDQHLAFQYAATKWGSMP